MKQNNLNGFSPWMASAGIYIVLPVLSEKKKKKKLLLINVLGYF